MRYRELFEHAWPKDLIDDLYDYQEYVDHDEVWNHGRHGWQDRLLAYMAEHPELQPTLSGRLYRATKCSDHVASLLLQGKSAIHTCGVSKLESWSKVLGGAAQYMEGIEDASAVLMALPAAKLRVVADIDAIVPSKQYDEHEVLVLAEDRTLYPSDVIAVIYNDYGARTYFRAIQPDFQVNLDWHEFERRLNQL